MFLPRTSLVPISGIKTSYKKKNSQERFDISQLGNEANMVNSHFRDVLFKLNDAVQKDLQLKSNLYLQ